MKKSVLPISVNICTYNEEDNILDCLNRVISNNPYEIIVIDGGSMDNTLNIIKSKMNECDNLKLILAKQKGFSSQRQEGIENSLSDYIAIIDADDHIEDDFLEILYNELCTFNFDAIQAKVKTFEPKTYLEKAMGSTVFSITDTVKPISVNMVGNPSLHKTQIIKECKFDSFFDTVGNEDSDLSIKYINCKYKLGLGTAITHRKHMSGFKEVVKKLFRYGRADARIIIKYPFKTKNILFHLFIRYPIVYSIKALQRGDFKYIPFYVLVGYMRLIGLASEYIKLKGQYNER